MNKFDHVRQATQTRDHRCHWPGCVRQVPPARWGCLTHWKRLPLALRRQIWMTYRAGQEIDMSPSAAYLAAARMVDAWIREHGGAP